MAALKLFPLAGMNNVVADDGLQRGGDAPKLFVRDAINVDISDTGRIELRKSGEQVTALAFKNLWQSPLHGDVFASLDRQIVKVDTVTWDYQVLADNVDTSIVCYELVNLAVFISTGSGILIYRGGDGASFLTIDTPAGVQLRQVDNGTLHGGTYTVAVSWLRGQVESGLSESSSIDIASMDSPNQWDAPYAAIQVSLPYCLDDSVTGVRVYCSERNGSSLKCVGDYAIDQYSVTIDNIDGLGMDAQYDALSAMPSGKFIRYWQGRLWTADKNVLRFSQALAYHLHDERHDFVLLPERITFVEPVDGGIWIGQVTHVVFLAGSNPNEMQLLPKRSRPPIAYSAITLDSQDVGEIAQGGAKTALWLAENGYALGTSSGQIIELHSGILKGITAKFGRSVRIDRRIVTTLS